MSMDKLEDELRHVWDDYYYALGKFFHMFARTEESLQACIANFLSARFVARDPRDAFALRAAMAQSGISAVTETLLRLLRSTKASAVRQQNLALVLTHLRQIANLRNRIAHNAGEPDLNNRGWFYTSNLVVAREPDKINHLHFSTKMLLDAAADVQLIADVVHGLMEPTWPHSPPPPKAWSYDPADVPPGYERLTASAPNPKKRSPKQRRNKPGG